MEPDAFRQSLSEALPPASLSPYLKALWYDARGDWESAHDIINDMPGEKAAWVHAYLHRKEGDAGNARYWYSRAGKSFSPLSLDEEWESIVIALL
jgi:hypothetical protein